MRLLRLHLRHWRGVEDREVRFARDGVTVVQGPNESGKSSLLEAFDVLLDEYDSTAKTKVKSIRPVHRDEGSEVEAEFTAGPYELVYRKRFFKRPETTLTVRGPRNESLTGREAHDRVRAILAETTDLDLWRALRVAQGGGLEPAELASGRWLAAALERAAGGAAAHGAAGGERERTILAAAEQEALRWWTPTGRETKEQGDAAARVEALTEEVARLREETQRVERDVEAAARIEGELTRQAAVAAQSKARADELGAELAQLQRLRTALAEREAAHTRAASGLREAESAVTRRREIADEARAAADAVADLEARIEAEAPGVEASRATLADAERDVAESTAAEEAAAAAAALAARDLDYRRDELDARKLADRWQRIQAAESGAATAEGLLAANRVDDACLAALRKAHDALTKAQGRLEAASASVRVTQLGDASPLVDGVPAPLGSGVTRDIAVAGALRIEAPGVLRVEIVAGSAAAAPREEHERCDAAFRSLCAEAGVADLDAATAAHATRREAQRVLEARDEIVRENLEDLSRDRLAHKLASVRARADAYAATRSATAPMPADFDAAQQANRTARTLHDEAAAAARAARARRDAARKGHDEASGGARVHEGRLVAARAEASMRATKLAASRADAADDDLLRRRDDAAAALGAADQALRDARADLERAGVGTKETLAANARAAAERAEAARRELERQRIEVLARIDATGDTGHGERLASKEADLAHAARDLAARRAQAAASKRLLDTLRAARDEAQARYVAPFRERVESLGRLVFGPTFEVTVADDLSIAARTVDGRTVPFESLSGGAREQLGVIARIACARLVAEEGGVPVVLDDALGFSDVERLERMGALLDVAGRDTQVIVLTCFPDRYARVGGATVVRVD